MTATYDVSTAVGQVRLLSLDTNITTPCHQDEEITILLTLEKGNVKLAAANALELISGNKLLTKRLVAIGSLKLDIATAPKALADRASELRRQVDQEKAEIGNFSVYENLGY